ncbi:alpha-1,4-glucan--maltose-1-phosphate maltosyltransferase [Sanguibacter sp. A247]|uniref:alpha-1,4-glucan--maltose-1-phosphate maltosyltransferase n=1 Tax=unclassified Sanguibacter TaxID=2645534 RepID=UPI003FD79DFB
MSRNKRPRPVSAAADSGRTVRASAPAALASRDAQPVPVLPTPIGRIPVVEVSPTVEQGRWPTKAVVGEAIPIRATVFREGHDAVGATAVLVGPDGTVRASARMRDIAPGLDRMEARVAPDTVGEWTFRVEGWSDPYGTWAHDASVKIAAGVDVELMLAEGVRVFDRVLSEVTLTDADRTLVADARTALADTRSMPLERLDAACTAEVREVLTDRSPLRDHVSPSADYPLVVSRELALAGAWYEMFPRSEGASYDAATRSWRSGTLRTAAERLPGVAAMGFDVIYLTPVHPIGTTFRKGRNNSLEALPGDPGSPYAIGSADGGHDAIHPELGTFDDFDAFVARARSLGLEVALDLALQCSPDHPWVTSHPEWFTTRVDGTIAYAENPPKKYQDIYPLNFDLDPDGLAAEIERIVRLWISHGVTAFRVDNPHTKPLDFWEGLLTSIRATNPEVIFLAEAFTRPAMMLTLARIGFQQSYTYFTWRNTRDEITSYLEEVASEVGSVMRPSFWPTTHDILTPTMQHGGETIFAIRAILAAMGSPTWGIYAGYEFAERVARPGAEEQIDNEKYEFKPRDWAAPEAAELTALLTRLNDIRRAHPALRQLRNLTVHPTTNDQVVAFSAHLDGEFTSDGTPDTVITVVTLDPWGPQESMVDLDLVALGLAPAGDDEPRFNAHDLLTGETYAWGRRAFVRLEPSRVAHIIQVVTP